MTKSAQQSCRVSLWLVACLVVIACSGSPVEPQEPVTSVAPAGLMTVGEVSAAESSVTPESVEALRGALEEAALRLGEDPRIERPLVLGGAISELQHLRESGEQLTVRATVSLSLSEAESGRILVVLDGTAQSRGAAPAGDVELRAVEAEVIRGAVDGAIRRLEPTLENIL